MERNTGIVTPVTLRLRRITMNTNVLYTYGMRLRPFAPGCQPKLGLVTFDDDVLNEYHSILLYNRPLSDKECFDYELDYLGKRRLKGG
jgi:hypothetical protein